MKSRRYPRVTCLLRVEELETRLTPAPVVLQPDLQITNIGTASDGPPAQMVFGPDARLYMTLANFSGPTPPASRASPTAPAAGFPTSVPRSRQEAPSASASAPSASESTASRVCRRSPACT